MQYWVNRFGRTPADEDYVEYYLNNSNAVEEESSYEEADQVIDYTNKDIEEEIDYMDNSVNNFILKTAKVLKNYLNRYNHLLNNMDYNRISRR